MINDSFFSIKSGFLSILLFCSCEALSQTQYDYYEGSPYDRSDAIDFNTLLGLIILGVIIFIIWFINGSIKLKKEERRKEEFNKAVELRRQKEEIRKNESEKKSKERWEKLSELFKWEKDVKEKLRLEAIELFMNDYCDRDIVFDGRIIRFNSNDTDKLEGFIHGYIEGNMRGCYGKSEEELKSTLSPEEYFGSIRGMREVRAHLRFEGRPKNIWG